MTQILTIAIKELRELLSRPWQALTLILGPLAIMIVFGIGSDATANPPRAIVVVSPGQEQPRLLRDYQRQFDQFLDVVAYTHDEAYAREQLRRDAVDAVLLLPPAPFEAIAGGQQATIRVLYNQIDPLWRWVVPNFTQVMASEINRELFLQTIREQQAGLEGAIKEVNLIGEALDLAIAAADVGDRVEARRHLGGAVARSAQLAASLERLGPEAEALRAAAVQLQGALQRADQRLAGRSGAPTTPAGQPLREQLGLIALLESVRQLKETFQRFTAVPPEVVISPLDVEAQNVARLEPDIVTFYAPSILALLVQHIAVSMGALALVRERLAGVFDLYVVAPLANLHLLLGKYLAYLLFTLAIAAVVALILLYGLHVPLLGSPWWLALTLVALAAASVGLGFALSLLASSERQAVQFAMLVLLAIVFFSGFTLPLDALRAPALAIAYALPATYGVSLLQDVMLRGVSGAQLFLLVLAAIAAALFVACLSLLSWRTRSA